MKSHLPLAPFENLALSLSGGGYRAAAFHLGLLTYLSSVKWKDKSLLERVRILSTVSGGTFTGVCYATTIAEGKSIQDCYSRMYRFMSAVDLIGEGLARLAEFNNWNSPKGRSLINAFSLIYYDRFEKNTFSILFDHPTHLKEIIFNATEFSYGLPFRFQKTMQADKQYTYAYLGNRQVNMPPEAVKEIRLADIMAASSCFPMGFEPINFPDDFRHGASPMLDELTESYGEDQWGDKCKFPVGLMDGGIVDNQGIDSVVWAEQRMQEYKGPLAQFASDDVKAIDLYLISDVSSPFMDSYVKTEEKPIKKWRKWSFRTFLKAGFVFLLAGGLSVYLACIAHHPFWIFIAGFFASLLFLLTGLSFFLSNMFTWLLKKFSIPDFFMRRLGRFTRMKFGVYETLIKNRISSVQSMVSDVFMKQVRRQEYGRVYNDQLWNPRLIMNAIYELTLQQTIYRNDIDNKQLSADLKNPDPELIKTAERAKSMGTTLWFTPEELEEDQQGKRSMPDTLIACGQYTGCFNLLNYIEKVLWGKENKEAYERYDPVLKAEIQEFYKALLSDWHKFNDNPFWMVDTCNQKMKP
ncbi:MAG: patatin-like phospholipase family protein [Bacteroidales bacterium]|nr:patatin-like phospholipase family protein [Bacteroidales bacterium]